ncbi:MAG: phosphoribosylglycinamide formyltransferase [Fusobacterium sp.]|uniref:phosphoribosylglycinamide formyltransferase n=1 Tax=Fusobacterium sp. TaxID=68766 RepID=UPI0026DC3EF9|nr:phosphoribosylglycinamide formyltransferase [Fusobacterium sp.]MDO4689948.1 phosphoribosylglycinamide formyltransferase [Fusobacterium sp.]
MSKIAVLVSGSGSNMRQLIKNGINLDCVIADRKCGAEQIAKENNIDFFQFEKNEISEKILKLLEKREIDLVVLAGFLSILNGELLKKYKNKIINIHPSLLPKYGGSGMYGMKVHQEVFKNSEKESGCTVHYVNEEIDAGAIIEQEKVDISSATSPEEIQSLVLEKEWKLLPRVVKKLIKK